MMMTPRERVLCAFAHREPDRVPVDLGGTESSGITGIAYNRLKRHLGIEHGKTRIFDVMQQIAMVENTLLDRVGSDTVPLLIGPKEWKTWALPDGSPCEIPEKIYIESRENGDEIIATGNGTPVMRRPGGGYYFNSIFHPLEEAKTEEDIDRGKPFFRSMDLPWYNDEGFGELKSKAERLYRETSRAVVGNLWVHLLAAGQEHRGYENFMVDLMVNKSIARRIMERQAEAYLSRVDRYVEAVGDHVDIIQVNDDLGTQNGPMLRPSLYREMVKPFHKELWEYIKRRSGKPLLLHSCGSIYEFIPDIIECGIDALNPVQVSAANMDTRRLKREFGKELVFWGGGCDTQRVLPQGTGQEVMDEVRRRVDDLAPDGGFVFCQVHNIQPDVPPENIAAMYEELGTLS
jgi:uroporphyrinogen decarboxylase